MTLRDYCRNNSLEYPLRNQTFAIRPASPEEAGIFYAMPPEEDAALSAIGHVRMDFGRSGKDFWHTWHPRGPEELNNAAFKAELQEVVDELRASLQAAAVQGVKSARSLAKFDEINRLSAPAAEKTAASAKEKQAAQAAAKAAKSTAGTTAGSTRRSGKAGTDAAEFSSVWQQVLTQLRGIWADFWAYLQGFFAPFVTAWQTVWAGLGAAVSSVWEPLWAELSTVVTPAVELLDTVWQGLWQGVQNAWAVYGQPILEGLAQGWQNVVSILSALWGGVVQPVFLQLFDLLAALWSAHLQPLWNELTACLGAVAALLLTVWNTVLAPFVQWLLTALAPVAVEVFTVLGTAVTGAAGIAADGITMLLAVLRGETIVARIPGAVVTKDVPDDQKTLVQPGKPAVPDKTVTVDRVVVDVLFEDDPAGEESEPDAGGGEGEDALLTVKRSAQALVELGEGSVTVRQNMAATRFFSAFNVPDGVTLSLADTSGAPCAGGAVVADGFTLIATKADGEEVRYTVRNELSQPADNPTPPASSQAGQSPEASTPVWVWILVAAGAVLVIAAAVLAVVLVRKRKQTQADK